jgi:peptidoglycan/xylan/chitin deacetylase (PgdA/CDA1 family)/ketosteroid isomerase-like protein
VGMPPLRKRSATSRALGRRVGLLCILAAVVLVAQSSRPRADEPVAARPLLVTVDDLPIAAGRLHRDPAERERITRGLLGALAKHRIRAVGLVTWSNVQGPADERLLGQWLDAGHELGNHTFGHLDYTATDSTAYIADVERGRTELARLLAPRGRQVRFFRFPFLCEGDTPEKLGAMRRYLRRSSQRNLPVTLDNQDWSFERGWVDAQRAGDTAALDSIGAAYQMQLQLEIADQESRGERLLGRALPQILLLHANEVGATQWDALFTWLESDRGGRHRFASADEVLADSAFSIAHDFVGRYGCGLWDRLLDARRRSEARASIDRLLQSSAASWNRGDLDTFCSDYAENALFISPTGTTRGREAVLARYRAKYRDRAAMGTLSFELVEVRLTSGMEATILGDARPARLQGASVVARWTLAYPDTTASGSTLLVLRPRGDGWEIVQDASM